MRSRIVLIILISVLSLHTFAQIQISKSNVDYSLKIEQDSVYKILTFWKDKDSAIYTSVKYSVTNFSSDNIEKYLYQEISIINQLWEIAEDSINYNLSSFNIGYPLLYTDILKNHIKAFLDSKEWQEHVINNDKKLDYKIIHNVMLEYDVYKPLNDFLKTKDYYISGFDTEKHGFITKEKLTQLGFSGNEIVPVPYIIWAKLSHIW